MKHLLITSALILLSFVACDTDTQERPATKFGTTVTPPPGPTAPPFTNPACNPVINKTECSAYSNFMVQYNANPVINVVNDQLNLTYTNSNNDQLELRLSPFKKGQSCNYSFTNDILNAKDYKVFIEMNANSLSFSSKYQVSSINSGILHVKYNAFNDSYNFVFCNVPFYTATTVYMNGRFDFIYQ